MDSILGQRIKSLREDLGLNQKELSEKIGIGNVTISQYENGKRSPDPEVLRTIADFFDTTTDYLLGLSDDRHKRTSNASDIFVPETIAAHLDGAELSETDIEDIARFIEFVKQKGNSHE